MYRLTGNIVFKILNEKSMGFLLRWKEMELHFGTFKYISLLVHEFTN